MTTSRLPCDCPGGGAILAAQPVHRTLAILVLLGFLAAGPASAARPAGTPYLPLAASIRSFDLVTAQQGWVLAGDRLYATGDAGSTWREITPRDGAGLLACSEPSLAAVSFAGPAAGMAVLVCSGPSGASAAALAQTADGGRTWALRLMPQEAADALASPGGAAHLQLVDARVGWLVVEALTSSNFSFGRLFATDNGGETWSERSLPIGGRVTFAGSQTGWAAGGATGSELYRTGDGGHTWVDLSPSPFEEQGEGEGRSPLYQLPILLDGGRALLPVTLPTAEGSLVRMYATQDDGLTWWLVAELEASAASPGVAVPVAALGPGKWLLRLPGSDTLVRMEPSPGHVSAWTAVPAGQGPLIAAVRALDMAGDAEGWALAQWGACGPLCYQETSLLRTGDGGATWARLTVGPDAAGAGPPAPSSPPVPQRGGGPSSRTRWITGQGLDTCEAPSLEALQAWMDDSPYRTTNLYIGGVNRACSNAGLTPGYVAGLSAQGWTLVPTWVGPQAACWGWQGAKMSYDPGVAYAQGQAEADAAVSAATALGLALPGEGTVLYYDLEAYDIGNSPCRLAAKSFIQGWTERLQAAGQVAGAYGAGCASAPSDWSTLPSPPEALWAAHWIYNSYTPEATVWNVACLSNSLWSNHQRLRQYTGGHVEVWGTTSLNIDCNVLDGIVADTREEWSCDPAGPCWYSYLPGILGP